MKRVGKLLKKITFLHAADLHLDSPFVGLSSAPNRIFKDIQESTFKALDNLVSEAIRRQVDFVLLVGDLFDHDVQSLKAQVRLREAFEKLAREKIDVFLSYGNHDFAAGNVHFVSFPENVHVFPDEKVTSFSYVKEGEILANIYGFSYEQRVIKENKAKLFKIENNEVPFHIAMLHGSIKSNVEHDVYAPFQLSDLRKEPFNYWALGHIHKREILSTEPYVVYPGNTQGRHRKELGKKGCYFVEMDEKETKLQFVPLQAITFESIIFDLANYHDFYEAKEALIEKLTNIKTDTPLLIDLEIHPSESLSLEEESDLEEFIEFVHEDTLHEKHWKYIFSVRLKQNESDTLPIGEHFIAQLLSEFEQIDIEESVESLFNHRQGRNYITSLTEEEIAEIKEQAKNVLLKGFKMGR